VLRELGATVWVIGNEPNGMNINDCCGAVHPERLQEEVLRRGAHAGLAHDGDADRVMFVDEQGRVVNGDFVLAMVAIDMKERGLLRHDTVVGTVMSNFGMDLALTKVGITLVRTPVGDRYLLEKMLAEGYNLGGEQSGHLIFLDYNTTGDGLISGLQVLKLMKRSGKALSELATCVTAVPQVLLGVKVSSKPDLGELPQVQEAIKAGEAKLDGTGRILVRYSGTEPLLRIMVEGKDQAVIASVADDLAGVVRACIGA
jgi:phosphoglucosamine mutase